MRRRRATLREPRERIAAGPPETRRGDVRDGEEVLADLPRRHEEQVLASIETGSASAPVLPAEALTREALYSDHD